MSETACELEIKHIRELLAARDKLYDERFESQKQATELALAIVKESGDKADARFETRMAGTNEWRQTLSDQQTLFIPRKEVEAVVKSLIDKFEVQYNTASEQIRLLQESNIKFASQAEGMRRVWLIFSAVVGLFMTALGIYAAFK